MLKYISVLIFFICVSVYLVAKPNQVYAQGISIIQDAEIENTIRAYAAPVFSIANLDIDSVEIYLVNDKSLNAFVAGGQKLFINTGLIMNSDSANQVIGVIAHETGHIAGGHLSRVHDALDKSSIQAIIGMVVGGIAGVATGRPDVGAAIIAGTNASAMGTFLHYSRTQEGAADQAALRYLEQTGQSAQGMLEFMETLSDQELLSSSYQDPYLRSHPLSRDRIRAIRQHIKNSKYSTAADSTNQQIQHSRLKAKLYAYTNGFITTLRLYKKEDNSVASRYARSIAHFRKGDIDGALPLIDSLLSESPNDPYYHELKGQMLFENNRPAQALDSIKNAARLLPGEATILNLQGRIQLELNDPAFLEPAIKSFQQSLQINPRSVSAWRQLAIAYGRAGKKGYSALALGEEALLKRKLPTAKYQAGLAATLFDKDSSPWLHAQDILNAVKVMDAQ